MDQARKGEEALSASKYDEAIQAFTAAIAVNREAVKYYIGRSTAYQRSSKYTEALADADIAVTLAYKRGVRELIKDSQFRRAVALFNLERYGDAEYLFSIVKQLDHKDKVLPIWNVKIATKLKDLPEGDAKRRRTVETSPKVDLSSLTAPSQPTKSDNDATSKPAPKPLVPTPANKIKLDWYQNNETVTLTVLAKGVPKDAAHVEIEKDVLSVSFPIQGSTADYSYSIDPLYASVDPTQSSYRVTPNKVEITLRKEATGIKWHSLESDREVQGDTENKPTIPAHVLTGKSTQDTAPVYPTSSKTGAKNWDKLATDEMDDKDEIEGDETSFFFKKLYKDAAPEQQRAMMKSYQESGGTVLSTDWGSVSQKTVVPEPPDGMEAKKY